MLRQRVKDYEHLDNIGNASIIETLYPRQFAKAQEQQEEEHWIFGRMADKLEEVSNGRWKFQCAWNNGSFEDKVL